MNVGIDELERLLKRYVSTGAAVVVVILGPGQASDAAGQPATAGQPTTVTTTPSPAYPSAGGPPPAEGDPGDRDGASGSVDTDRATPDPTDRRSGASPDTRAPTTTGPRTRGAPAGAGAATEGTTAAATLGWGTPTRAEEFDAGTEQWSIYDGAGHAGKGRRSPEAVAVRDGVLTITGDSAGTTAGMSWGQGRKYGRWEGRVRAPAADPSYNALLLLWPDAENWPQGGEIDFMEMGDASRQKTDAFIHYGADNKQVHGSVETDATQWHNWAVEWTPSSITTFLDGREWFRTTDAAVQPPGPMHLCIQLDWFPKGGAVRESTMQVDWVREYALDSGSGSGSGSGSAGGAGASGADGTSGDETGGADPGNDEPSSSDSSSGSGSSGPSGGDADSGG